MPKPYHELPTFTADGTLRVVIETAKGSRNKYAWDEECCGFELRHVLPEGLSFPFDFGMVPSTLEGDGGPMDALVIMDAPAFPGCLLAVRLIGALEAEEKAEGDCFANNRLIGVAARARTEQHVQALSDLRPGMLDEVEGFFEHYNRLSGKQFRPKRRLDVAAALQLVEKGRAAFAAKRP